jgi:hypothetical protein
MRLGSVDVGRGHWTLSRDRGQASRSTRTTLYFTSSTTFTSDLREDYLTKASTLHSSIARIESESLSTMSEEAKKSTLQSLRNWGGKFPSKHSISHVLRSHVNQHLRTYVS